MRGLGKLLLIAAVVGAVASSAWAIPYFPGESNRLVGDPRRGTDEDYTNTPGGVYLTPANLNGGPVLPGSVAGHTESIRLFGPGLSSGINIPQPAIVPAADPRSAYNSPTALPSYGLAPMWGARAGAAVQWQSIADGSSVPLLPFGSVSGQAFNLNISTPRAAVLGIDPVTGFPGVVPLVDDGLAPGSFDEPPPGGTFPPGTGGIYDSVPWFRDLANPGLLVTGFGLQFVDPAFIAAQAAAGFPWGPGGVAGATQTLSARIKVYEGGALFDQIAGSFNENNFNHNGGTNGMVGDELNDAVDGTLLLSGVLENITVINLWTAPLAGVADIDGDGLPEFIADATKVRRTITVNGSVNWSLDDAWAGGLGAIESVGSGYFGLLSPTGSFSASWTNIPFTNTTGTDGDGVYDFMGDQITSYSADLTFIPKVPEPLSVISSILAMGALGGYVRRRRTA